LFLKDAQKPASKISLKFEAREQRGAIVPAALDDDGTHVACISNAAQRIAVHNEKVGDLACLDRPEPRVETQRARALSGRAAEAREGDGSRPRRRSLLPVSSSRAPAFVVTVREAPAVI
jgi:hypothetical protein